MSEDFHTNYAEPIIQDLGWNFLGWVLVKLYWGGGVRGEEIEGDLNRPGALEGIYALYIYDCFGMQAKAVNLCTVDSFYDRIFFTIAWSGRDCDSWTILIQWGPYTALKLAVNTVTVPLLLYSLTHLTYTMIGDKELKSPGIAPRAMDAIYQLMDDQKWVCEHAISLYLSKIVKL